MNKKDLISTGNMAKFHNINKRTLFYYDEIGLFQPYYRDEKAFRYYHSNQHQQLELILSLRALNMPISKIFEFIQQSSSQALFELLTLNKIEIENRIKQLQDLQVINDSRLTTLSKLNKIDEINIVYHTQYELSIIPHPASLTFTQFYNLLKTEINHSNNKNLYCFLYGRMLQIDQVLQANFENYSYLFIKKQALASTHSYTSPAGQYIETFHRGPWHTIQHTYQKILQFTKENNLDLHAYAFEEMVIDSMTESDEKNYVTRILIPIA